MTAEEVVKEILQEGTHGVTASYEFCKKIVETYANQKALSIIEQAVGELEEEFPYKDATDRDSYSPHRDGLNDGFDAVLTRIKEQLSE